MPGATNAEVDGVAIDNASKAWRVVPASRLHGLPAPIYMVVIHTGETIWYWAGVIGGALIAGVGIQQPESLHMRA